MMHPAALVVAGLAICLLIDLFVGYLTLFRRARRGR